MATNTLHIRVRSDGTRVVSKDIKGIGEAANLASRQIFIMRRAISTLIAAAGVRAGFRAIEEFTELNNKLKTVTKTTEELIAVRRKLLAIANDSRTSLSATVQLYSRTTRAVEQLGLSEEKRLKFTSLLTKEAVVGGATTVEATNAIRQLTQGMGAAGLKGEELRSVLEQLPTVAKRIADFLGVAQSELRKLGEEGKLTGEVVVAAMLAAEDSINSAFGETTSTVGQSFEVFKNNFIEFAGKIDQVVGGSKALAGALRLVATNLELISALLIAIVARAAFVALANNGLTLAAAVSLAGVKVLSFVRSLFLVGTAIPVIKSTTNAFLAMTAAVAVSRTASVAALPTIAGLSLTAMLGIVAAVAALTLGFVYLISKQNKYVTDLEKATQAEKDHAEAIRQKTLALQFRFDGKDPESQIQKDIARRNDSPFARLKNELPEVSKKIDVLRAGILSLSSDQLGLNIVKLSGTDKQIQAATEKVEKTKQALDDVRQSFSDVNLAATKDMSVATVMRDAEIAAKGFGGELAGLKKLAEGLVDLLDRSQLTQLTPDEKGGTEFQQTAAKVAGVAARLNELKNAYAENTLTTEDYNQALAVNKEKLDELTGSSSARTSQLVAENAIFKQFGGDLEAISMRLAGATEDQVRAYMAAKAARASLSQAQADAIASERAAENAARRNTEAIQSSISALKEELRLFGLVGKARQLAQFEALPGVSGPDLDQFKQLQNQITTKEISANLQTQIAEFKATASALNEAAKTAQENAARLGPDKLKEVNEDLVRGKDALGKAAVALANSIAADLGTAGEQSIEEIRAALVTGAGTIGTQAGTALVTAFKAAVLGAVPGLNSLLPPGVSGISSPEQDTQRDANTQAFDASNEAAKRTAANIAALNETARLFGPTLQTSARQGGSALSGFGDQANDIGSQLKNTFSSIFGSLEDALVGFVTTGKLDFKSLINSIIADLARMVIQMLIIRPLMGFFGGFFGGIFGFSGGGSVGGAFGLPSFAGGGLVSDDPLAPARFATGGRVHGPGTGVSDSVNALLSRDEFVVNAAASRPNMAGLEYLNSTGRMPGGGNVTSVAYAPNVSITVEGNSDRAAGNGAQIAKDFEQQMRAQFNEFVAQEQRPGGAFSKTNDDVL
jgi:lambda family phage tail tape measure protein